MKNNIDLLSIVKNMKPIIPLSAIIIYSIILWLVWLGILPNPEWIAQYIQSIDSWFVYFILFIIILLESIIYIGFYLPWQFIAVLVILSYTTKISDIFILSIISIIAVTISAAINYYLWYYFFRKKEYTQSKINYKQLLFSMIHINTIALYMFDQWSKKSPKSIIFITWLLNLPYYFLIILVTFLLKDQVMSMSENSYILFFILFSWLSYSIYTEKKVTT
jgi:membrane-associated protein